MGISFWQLYRDCGYRHTYNVILASRSEWYGQNVFRARNLPETRVFSSSTSRVLTLRNQHYTTWRDAQCDFSCIGVCPEYYLSISIAHSLFSNRREYFVEARVDQSNVTTNFSQPFNVALTSPISGAGYIVPLATFNPLTTSVPNPRESSRSVSAYHGTLGYHSTFLFQ